MIPAVIIEEGCDLPGDDCAHEEEGRRDDAEGRCEEAHHRGHEAGRTRPSAGMAAVIREKDAATTPRAAVIKLTLGVIMEEDRGHPRSSTR